jgi:hypothetical protein
MPRFGKRLLAAFVELADDKKAPEDSPPEGDLPHAGGLPHAGEPQHARDLPQTGGGQTDDRFAGHFDKLLSEANIPGPDYYEFSRMIGVMRGIPDDAARYNAAFAGLQVQGLDKQRLLETAAEYLRVLVTDAGEFQKTVNNALQEKVTGKEAEAEEKAGRIRALSQEILQLQQEIGALQHEVRANK